MDDVAQYNMDRWSKLVDANALFSRPRRDLTVDSARTYLDAEGLLGQVRGKRVLCLASGGGQQSAAFAVLGAEVTVLDISEGMLERDREMAEHYQREIETIQGDMRDLSGLGESTFDIVWHPYSLNFVPDARVVFGEVGRVLRDGGLYHFNCSNPFFTGLTERDWSGTGYILKRPYIEGEEVTYGDSSWVYDAGKYAGEPIPGPREYRHTLGTLVNGLAEQGFIIVRLSEQMAQSADVHASPGTWDHFTAIAPPWLAFWAIYRPDVLKR